MSWCSCLQRPSLLIGDFCCTLLPVFRSFLPSSSFASGPSLSRFGVITHQPTLFFLSTLTPHHSSPPLRCPSLCSLGTCFAFCFPCTFLSNTCPFYRFPLLIPVSLSLLLLLYSFVFFCLLSIFLRPILLLPISPPFGVPFSTPWHLSSSHTNLTYLLVPTGCPTPEPLTVPVKKSSA